MSNRRPYRDIWSWGVVLYELLTSERLFQGEDAAETLAAVIHKQPDLEKAPLQVRTLLRRCLEKDPKKRLRDISVAKEMLVAEETAPSQSRLGIIASAAAVVLFATAVGLGWIAWRATRPVEHSLVRLDVDLGSNVPSGYRTSHRSRVISLTKSGFNLVLLYRPPLGPLR